MKKLGSMRYQYSQIETVVNGISKKKRLEREKSNIISENGKKVSPYIHSHKSRINSRNDMINLFRFAKTYYKIRDVSVIGYQVIKDWIISKQVDKGGICYDTASNYISEINKISEYLDITREEMKELRVELHEILKIIPKTTRAYSMKKLLTMDIHPRSRVAFELQRDYGLRISAATYIDTIKNLKGNNLSYRNKGGKLMTITIRSSLRELILRSSSNGIYNVVNRTYARDLQKIIEASGQKWTGTHSMRHTFCQHMLKNKTKAQVSLLMGHVRESITDVYLR